MGKVYPPGTLVREFKLVELAGDGTRSNVYLAVRDQTHYWLLQLEDKSFDPQVPAARLERFELESERWLALPTGGTSIFHLADWVDRLELPFIGWRWALFARDIGLLHQHNKVMQQANPLSLERLVLNEQGELIFAQANLKSADEFVFAPPEGLGHSTPAGDVYSLGASLQALLGTTVPPPLKAILERATRADPTKRFKTASEFAEELARVLPDPNRVKPPRPPTPVRSYVRWGCTGAAAVLVLCCLLFACSTIYTLRDPNFQRELERQLQEQAR